MDDWIWFLLVLTIIVWLVSTASALRDLARAAQGIVARIDAIHRSIDEAKGNLSIHASVVDANRIESALDGVQDALHSLTNELNQQQPDQPSGR